MLQQMQVEIETEAEESKKMFPLPPPLAAPLANLSVGAGILFFVSTQKMRSVSSRFFKTSFQWRLKKT